MKMKRKDMGAHEQDKAHLHQVLNTVVKLQDDLQSAIENMKKESDDIAVKLRKESNDMAVKLKRESEYMATKLRKESNDMAIKLKRESNDMAVQLRRESNIMAVQLRGEREDMAVKLRRESNNMVVQLRRNGSILLFIGFLLLSVYLYHNNTETIASMKEDNKVVQDRLQSATETIASMKEENKAVQDKLQSATETIASMKEDNKAVQDRLHSMRKKSVIFKIMNYEEKKKNNEVQSFYIGIDEYNMHIKVYPNGLVIYEGTHVSVFVHILKGDNDDNLDWPFIGTVEIELLNQLEDNNHHLMTLTFNQEDNKRVGSSWGYYRFIPHSKLSHDPYYNTQYLKDNTLYFRVSVEVSGHKPWLECTLK